MKKIIALALALICILGIVDCANKKEAINNSAMEAYSTFLSGDTTLLADGCEEKWYIPDCKDTMKYESQVGKDEFNKQIDLLITEKLIKRTNRKKI